MTRERELLLSALDFLSTVGWGETDRFAIVALAENIRELLDQPEQEPDLWVVTNSFGINKYLYSKPRKQVYETYRVTAYYKQLPKGN